jgi:hypothetical protein
VGLAVPEDDEERRLDEALDPGVDLPGTRLGEPPAPGTPPAVMVRSESSSSTHARWFT